MTDGSTIRRSSSLAGAALIAAAALAAYLPSLRGSFILDDNLYLTDAPFIKAPDGLYRFWCTFDALDYYPVSNTTLWLEWRLWGTNPTGYRVTNLLLHIASTLLICAALRKLRIPGAYLAAILFAVHPVNVESVAWIAQRKGLLAAVFFLLSILSFLHDDYVRATNPPSSGRARFGGRWYWVGLLSFVLAMLSKGSVATLPLILLLLAWWQRGRIASSDLLRAAPFALAAILLTAVHVHFQSGGLSETIRDAGFAQRLAGAAAAVWFYLDKAIWPLDLIFVYPQWAIQAGSIIWWLPLIAAVALTAVLVWRRNTWWGRPLLFAWIYFCLVLVPVLGFTDVGYMKHSLVADHYQYLAIVAVTALVAAVCTNLHRHASAPVMRPAILVTIVAIVAALTLLTRKQSGFYESPVTLYRATLEKNPTTWLIHNDLGVELDAVGQTQEAIECYNRALQIKSNYADARNNLALALEKTGRIPEAIEQFHQSLKIQPSDPKVQLNLALALLESGQTDDAVKQAQEAVPLLPRDAKLYDNLGQILLRAGRPAQSVPYFEQSLQLDPADAQAYNNFATALAKLGRIPEAIERFQKAIALRPKAASIHKNLGRALDKANRPQDALEQYRQAVELKPDDADSLAALAGALADAGQTQQAIEQFERLLLLRPESAPDVHCAMGTVLDKSGQPEQAIEQYEQALKIEATNLQALNNLAWALSNSPVKQLRDPERSVELATQAVKLDPKNAGAFNTLGIAYYRAGNPQDAIQWLNKSVEAGGGTSFDWFFLAMANEKLAHRDEARKFYQKAVQWIEQHAPQSDELLRFRREAEELLAGKSASDAAGQIK